MDSSSGGSSTGLIQNSGSEELMEERKRKRMISNRESARRSRMRKQQHLDDLIAQLAQLRKQNSEIINNLSVTTQHFLDFEAENSVLRAQEAELSHRLESLNEIIHFINNASGVAQPWTGGGVDFSAAEWNIPASNYSYLNQPIMACADMFQH